MSEFNPDNIIIYNKKKFYKCSCNEFLKKFSPSDFKKHIQSKKHIENTNYVIKDDDFVCECGIILKCYHESDLIRHNASKTHIERMELLKNANLIEEEKNKKNDFKKFMTEKLDKILKDIELCEKYEFRIYEQTNRIQRLKRDTTAINPMWENLCNHGNCVNGTRDLFCKSHNTEIDNRLENIVEELNLSLTYDYRIAPINKDEIQRKNKDKDRWITMCNKCHFNIPSYNYEGETKPILCGGCRELDMVSCYHRCNNILENGNKCKIIVKGDTLKKYNGYCYECFCAKYPDEIKKINRCIKEKAVVDIIKNNYEKNKEKYEILEIKYDKSCDYINKRPDIIIIKNNYVIIIEVDEFQHKKDSKEGGLYSEENEKNKMKLIKEYYKSLDKKIIYIRFNPDNYISKNNIKIKSPWDLNEKNDLIIKNSTDWEDRIKILKIKIEFYLNKKEIKKNSTLYLFYDNY